MRAALQFQSCAFKEHGCKMIYYSGVKFDDQAYLERDARRYTLTIYHPCGTCKMGTLSNDDMAVCDANTLKVRGFGNLRVCDASIMPHLTSGNTQAPCFVIGERGADFILKQWEQHRHRH